MVSVNAPSMQNGISNGMTSDEDVKSPYLPTRVDQRNELVGEEAYISPHVPFTCRVFGGCMKEGTRVIIDGQLEPYCTSFRVLLCGPTMDNIALLFSPCSRVGYVVRSSRKKGKWSKIEATSRYLPRIPFYLGEDFSICIYCTPKSYMIAVNGHHFTEYSHHLPVNQAKYCIIKGPLILHKVAFQRVDLPYPPYQIYDFPSEDGMISIPYRRKLPMALVPGTCIRIHGRVKTQPREIVMSLQSDPYVEPPPSYIGLCISAQYGYSHILSVSSYMNGKLTEKHPVQSFPLLPYRVFFIEISVLEFCFRITINDEVISDFSHKGNCNNLNCILIHGDLHLKALDFD